MDFLKDWTIDLDKLAEQKYTAFNGQFEMKLDYGILKLCYDSDLKDADGDLIFNEERKVGLKILLLAIDKKTGILKCTHKQRYGIGRYYADFSQSPICVSRVIKHTLFKYLDWIDLDMVKGHPTILKQIASKNNYDTPILDLYLADPTAMFKKIIDHYSIDEPITEEEAKEIFNIGIYGGSHQCWLLGFEAKYKDGVLKKKGKIVRQQAHPLVAEFFKECGGMIDTIYAANSISKWNDPIKIKERCCDCRCNCDCACDNSKLTETDKKRRVMSYFCGAIENHIVHIAAKTLQKDKWLKPKKFGQELDGFCFPRPKVSSEEMDLMVKKVNDIIFEKTKLAVKMKFKGYKDEHIITPILEARKTWKLEEDVAVDAVEDERDEEIDYGKVVDEGDEDAIDILYESIKNDIKFCNGILYYKHKGVWITDVLSIKANLNVYVSKFGLTHMVCKKLISYTSKRSVSLSLANGVIDIAITKSDDGWYKNIFKSSLGKILFENGYWDFKESRWYDNTDASFDHSIVFLEKINYEFNHNISEFSDDDLDYIDSVFNRLFEIPFGKEVGGYYCEKLARGLAGDCQKNFLIGVGAGNTGKSIMGSVVKASCDGYFGAYNGVNLKYKTNVNDEAQALRWYMLLQTKRIIMSSEIAMGTDIDGNMLKKVSNGGLDTIIGRGHSGNETPFMSAAFAVLFANDIDNIKPIDDAVRNRLVCIDYKKVCVDEVVNPEFEMKIDEGLKDEIETPRFKNAFMWLLINSYKKFHIDNDRVDKQPEGCHKAFKTIIGDSGDDITTKFLKDFEITGKADDFLQSSAIETWLKGSGISIKKFSAEFNKYLIINKVEGVINKAKKIGGKSKCGWYGISEPSGIEEEQ